MIGNLKTDISSAVGGAVSTEVDKMLSMFATNSESIENNFSSLRQRIEDLEQNVIGTIKREMKNAVDSL